MPRNDGSEILMLNAKLKIARAGSSDAYRQLGDSLQLLKEARTLLVLCSENQRPQFKELIEKIDTFYPKGE